MDWLPWFVLAALTATLLWLWRRYRRQQALVRTVQGALAAAHRENERLARYLDAVRISARSGILLVDEDARVVWISDSAREWLMPEVPPPPFPLDQVTIAAPLIPMAHRVFRDGREESRQFQIEERVFWARAIPLAGEPPLVVLAVEDVTELQRLGRARRDFVANISHDLRTPITTIQLLVETLRLGAIEKPKEANKLLNSIADQTLTLQQLAQELMDLSLIESGRMPLRLAATPLSAIIEPPVSRLETQIEHKSLHLQRAYDPDLLVLADKEILQRVIQNLLHNAIKFTPKDGTIIIGAKTEDDQVLVWLKDSGPGISPEHLDRIFERFYKTDPARAGGGSGLGLAIAKHIVEGHGGRIWVKSKPGEGATFYFTLLQGS